VNTLPNFDQQKSGHTGVLGDFVLCPRPPGMRQDESGRSQERTQHWMVAEHIH
jgi:hypothetical protein